MIIRADKGDGGYLLQGVSSPILPKGYSTVFVALPTLQLQWKIDISKGLVPHIDLCWAFLVGEVLADLHGHGKHHVIAVKKNGTFKLTRARDYLHVYISVVIALYRKICSRLLARHIVIWHVKAVDAGFHVKTVGSRQRIVAKELHFVSIFAQNREILFSERLSFVLYRLKKSFKIRGLVGIDAVTHIKVVFVAALLGRHGQLTVFGARVSGYDILIARGRDMQLALVLTERQNVSENTRTLDEKSHKADAFRIDAVKAVMVSVFIGDNKLFYGIGVDLRNYTDLGNISMVFVCRDLHRFIQSVGIGMIYAVHNDRGCVTAVYTDNTHFAYFKRGAYLSADIKAHFGNIAVIIGHLIKENTIRAIFSVTDKLKAHLCGVVKLGVTSHRKIDLCAFIYLFACLHGDEKQIVFIGGKAYVIEGNAGIFGVLYGKTHSFAAHLFVIKIP